MRKEQGQLCREQGQACSEQGERACRAPGRRAWPHPRISHQRRSRSLKVKNSYLPHCFIDNFSRLVK